jgi:HKD family nuclease
VSVTVYMDDLQSQIQLHLNRASREVRIAIAWISFDQYESIFRNLVSKGVKVKILCSDTHQNRSQSATTNALRHCGVDIRLCTMPRTSNFMHHKFCIIDQSIVLNGSFNWSKNASRSFENLLVIKDEPQVVTQFLSEFNKVSALDQAAIRSLQAIQRCRHPKCSGKLVNILVFSSMPQPMTYELWGDVVQFCTVCGSDDFEVVNSAVQDTMLHGLFEGYQLDDEIDNNQVDRDIDSQLTGYAIRGTLIHGIGFVVRGLIWRHEDDICTRIIWKNKFVTDQIDDRYETDFDVLY